MKKIYLWESLNCGSFAITPYVRFDKKDEIGVYELLENGEALRFFCKNGCYSDEICITETENGFIAKRSYKNNTSSIQRVRELALTLDGITFGEESKKDYFYHTENPRIYEQMTFPVDYNRTSNDASNAEFDVIAGNKWADPGIVVERIGASPYQPFPAILLSNYKSRSGLVHGTLSQKVFFHNYLVSHSGNGIKLDIFSSFKSIEYREIKPGEILIDEWYIGATNNADNIEKIFENYSNELRKKLPASYGASGINRDNVVWGSWNDGIFRNISEDMLLEEAKALKENFPTVKWFQLDDGYSSCKTTAHGLGVPYENEDGIDKAKFPNGLRHFTDSLREIGLRPAIWIGGSCPADRKLVLEHSDWFCDFSERFSSIRAMDVSLPEVKEYALFAFDKLCLEYGFDAVKHDFWSYPFESSGDYLKNKYASGYEHRSWWLNEIRKRIPTDGYLQTGCDIVMGNPFLGEYFTNYRYGIDIGEGNWENVRTNFLWGIACFATHTGDLFVPNSDAVGLFPGLNDTDAEFCINYILITRSMVELAGRFSSIDKSNPRFKMLKKAVACPNNGDDVYLGSYDYRKPGRCTPELIFIKTPHFSTETHAALPIRTLALFNIEEREKSVTFTPAELGLQNGRYVLTDIWCGEQIDFESSLTVNLTSHESRLFSVNTKSDMQIYDSNIKISDVKIAENYITIKTHYASDAELLLSIEVEEIEFNGEKLEFTNKNGATRFKIPGSGELKITGVKR